MSSGTFDLLWSITNGIFPLGGVFGAFASGYVGDFFGRYQQKSFKIENILINNKVLFFYFFVKWSGN